MFDELERNSKANIEFSSSVTRLLTIQQHPINMKHFARLLKDQMLASCLNEAYNTDEKDSEAERNLEGDLKLLSLKEQTGAAIWSKLQSRMSMCSSFGDICPKPNFGGSQEFFKHFIANSTYGFIIHFKELLVKSILTENEVMDMTKNNAEVYDTILRLRILGKFLSFIESLPYYKILLTQTAHDTVKDVIESRSKVWQYGLWSFQMGGTKLERFLAKNQW